MEGGNSLEMLIAVRKLNPVMEQLHVSVEPRRGQHIQHVSSVTECTELQLVLLVN